MQVKFQNDLSFKSRYQYSTPKQRKNIIEQLESSNISYKELEDENIILTGKTLHKYVKEQAQIMKEFLSSTKLLPTAKGNLKSISAGKAKKILNNLGYKLKTDLNTKSSDRLLPAGVPVTKENIDFARGVKKAIADFRRLRK